MKGGEQIYIHISFLLDQFYCTVKMVSNCTGYLLSSFLKMLIEEVVEACTSHVNGVGE